MRFVSKEEQMRIVIQRVSEAKVLVGEKITGAIGRGLLVLVGIGENDTKDNAKYLVDKLLNMRIFEDDSDKLNYSLLDIDGELLLVPNFTLYANCKKGNRPNFFEAAKPMVASEVFNHFVMMCSDICKNVKTGQFAEHMKVELVNDGPVTIVLDN